MAPSYKHNLLLSFLLTAQLLPEEATDSTPTDEDLKAYRKDLQADIKRSLPPQAQVESFYHGVHYE